MNVFCTMLPMVPSFERVEGDSAGTLRFAGTTNFIGMHALSKPDPSQQRDSRGGHEFEELSSQIAVSGDECAIGFHSSKRTADGDDTDIDCIPVLPWQPVDG